jgi:hypothetical protein
MDLFTLQPDTYESLNALITACTRARRYASEQCHIALRAGDHGAAEAWRIEAIGCQHLIASFHYRLTSLRQAA